MAEPARPPDWKRHYAGELAQPWGRAALQTALAAHPHGDAAIAAALRRGGVVSFPHVSLRDSAQPIARVVQTLLGGGWRHVVALGVLHGGTLPLAERAAWAAMAGDEASPARSAAFQRFAGAFHAGAPHDTPYGRVAAGPLPSDSAWLHTDAPLLQGEFSLDLFLAMLAAAAHAQGVPPPAVSCLYIGQLREPDGGFDAARAVAGEVRALLREGVACVATGDLAHIGHGYMSAAETAALPAEADALLVPLRAALDTQYAAALARHDLHAAWELASRWRNDQRQVLMLLAELLGPGASHEWLSLALSDYSAINNQPRPCWVASALASFQPALRNTPLDN